MSIETYKERLERENRELTRELIAILNQRSKLLEALDRRAK